MASLPFELWRNRPDFAGSFPEGIITGSCLAARRNSEQAILFPPSGFVIPLDCFSAQAARRHDDKSESFCRGGFPLSTNGLRTRTTTTASCGFGLSLPPRALPRWEVVEPCLFSSQEAAVMEPGTLGQGALISVVVPLFNEEDN